MLNRGNGIAGQALKEDSWQEVGTRSKPTHTETDTDAQGDTELRLSGLARALEIVKSNTSDTKA